MEDGTRSSKQLEEDLKKTDDKVDKLASDMSQLSILMAQLVHQQQKLMEHFQNSTAHVTGPSSSRSKDTADVQRQEQLFTAKDPLRNVHHSMSPVKGDKTNDDDHVSSISTSDFSIDKVDESDAVQTELLTTELCAPVESGLVSENTANEVIVAEGVFEDSDALYLDGSIDLVLDSSRVCSVSKSFTVKGTSNLCLSDVCANASMNVPFIADGRYVKPPAKPPEDGSSKNVDYIQFDSSAILDIKSLNWAFVGVLVHYDGLVERLKLIDQLEIDTIFLKKWHDGAEGLFEFQTDIKLNDIRKFGCIDNINMTSELMEAGHFSESCNGLYLNVRLVCPATGKQFVVKEILVLVLHKLVDDAFKFYKQEGSLGDSGSFYYGMRLDSGQSCDLDRNTKVSSLCGDLHIDKQAAIRNTIIMVYKDVKQLTILWAWDLWDQITLKENNQEGSNENTTIIDMFRLLNIHPPVYLASIITEVSTVMVPYSKWHGKEMFKTQNLLTGVWKNKSKFQGFIISDWEGLDMSTSQTHKNYTHLVLVGKQAVSGMVLSPPLHLKTNESEDEKKTQEVLRTKIFLMRFVNKIFIFSLPRPPEIDDLEDKVDFKGEGMLGIGLLRKLRGLRCI